MMDEPMLAINRLTCESRAARSENLPANEVSRPPSVVHDALDSTLFVVCSQRLPAHRGERERFIARVRRYLSLSQVCTLSAPCT
jgi:hypothetical protein